MVLPSKEIRICHKVYKHLQQGSLLNDECVQDDLCQVYTIWDKMWVMMEPCCPRESTKTQTEISKMCKTTTNPTQVDLKDTLGKKPTIHQATTMLVTSKTVLFPAHNHHANHQYWWPFTRWCLGDNQSVGSSVPVVSMVVMTWKEDIFRSG